MHLIDLSGGSSRRSADELYRLLIVRGTGVNYSYGYGQSPTFRRLLYYGDAGCGHSYLGAIYEMMGHNRPRTTVCSVLRRLILAMHFALGTLIAATELLARVFVSEFPVSIR